MNPDICAAIHRRQLLRFAYDPGMRTVEPYAYGVGEGGRELLRGFQIAGGTHSLEYAWKLFRVDEISGLVVLDETFEGVREGYMRNDPSMTQVYCEL